MFKEKLFVLSEEVIFLYDICKFYERTEIKVSYKEDLEANFLTLRLHLEKIYSDIQSIDDEINSLLKRTKLDNSELMVLVDYYRGPINEIIKQLKVINSKTNQMFRDGYNQYMPKPTPGRMVSNINMTSQIENSLEFRLKRLLQNNDIDGQPTISLSAHIIWEFTDNYEITTDQIKKDGHVLNIVHFHMSYWYFELPYLLPALTHEIAHFIFKEKSYEENLNRFRNEVDSKIKNSIDIDPRIEELHDDSFITKLTEEIFADILSLSHHGVSFLFTMVHEFLGKELSDTFEVVDINYHKDINIAEWRFSKTRDSLFIRLSLLTHFVIKKKNEPFFGVNIDQTKEVQKLLNLIYSNDKNNGNSIREFYNYWHNYRDDFIFTEKTILEIISIYQTAFKKHKNIFNSFFKEKPVGSKENLPECKQVPKYYEDIWYRRFSNIKENKPVRTYKNELRQKIHFDTICRLYNKYFVKLKWSQDNKQLAFRDFNYQWIEFCKRSNILKSLDMVKPYILTFYKFKIDDNTQSSKKSKTLESALGIYDAMSLKQVPEEIKIPELKNNTSTKYKLKFSLMKITDPISGSNLSEEDILNMTVQIEVLKNLENNDIYDTLYKNIQQLYKILNGFKCKFKEASVYKSLGPKDLIIKVDGCSIATIYKIKKKLSDNFARTFTTLSYNNEKIGLIKSDNNYKLSTEIRLSQDKSYKFHNDDDIKKLAKKIDSFYIIPGAMDYRIDWKESTTIGDIERLYDILKHKGKVSDIQTFFIKKEDISPV